MNDSDYYWSRLDRRSKAIISAWQGLGLVSVCLLVIGWATGWQPIMIAGVVLLGAVVASLLLLLAYGAAGTVISKLKPDAGFGLRMGAFAVVLLLVAAAFAVVAWADKPTRGWAGAKNNGEDLLVKIGIVVFVVVAIGVVWAWLASRSTNKKPRS